MVRLTYLDMPGFAEAIRLAFKHGNIEFEDRRITYAQVHELRISGALPFGQVPVLEIDGVTFGQSDAILRWVGCRSGLYPEHLRLKIDGALACIADINTAFVPQFYGNALGRNPRTGQLFAATALSEEQQAAVERHLNEDVLPARFAQLERFLVSSGGPHLCGKQMTVCDLTLYVLLTGLRDGSYCRGSISPAVLQDCPKLNASVDLVASNLRARGAVK